VHCDHTYVSADLSLWLDSPMFWASVTPQHVHLLPAVFFQFQLEEKLAMDVQNRRDISRMVEDRGYKLLLSVIMKSYIPRRLAPQRMILSDLEWPFHIVRIARYLCSS